MVACDHGSLRRDTGVAKFFFVGDHVNVVCGSYRGKDGVVQRLTLCKVEVRLGCGKVVLINQSSVCKRILPDVADKKMGTTSERAIVVAEMKEELFQLRRSVEILESLMGQLTVETKVEWRCNVGFACEDSVSNVVWVKIKCFF